jgi:aerobic C4-dicarboxylate transport protein
MSQIRSLTNLVGNGVATVVIAKWENEFAEPSPAMEEPVPVIESELSPDLT